MRALGPSRTTRYAKYRLHSLHDFLVMKSQEFEDRGHRAQLLKSDPGHCFARHRALLLG